MLIKEKISEFNKIMQSLDYSKSRVQIFSDFLSLSTYSIANVFYRSPELEDRYKMVAKNYKPEQLNLFSKLLMIVVEALEEESNDFLGTCFMSNDMGSEYKGQFFTPYHVSMMMAQTTLGNVKELVKEKGYITISEPCSGAGGMIIACREVFIQQGCNPSTQMFVEAIDIDDLCFKMSYIQLSLLGIAAQVVRGNTLSMEYFETLLTPVYFLNGWRFRTNQMNCIRKSNSECKRQNAENNSNVIQMSLFRN